MNWKLILLGCLFAIIAGTIFSFIFSKTNCGYCGYLARKGFLELTDITRSFNMK